MKKQQPLTRSFVTLLLVLIGFGAIFGIATLLMNPNHPNNVPDGRIALYFSHSEGDTITLVPTHRDIPKDLGPALLDVTTQKFLKGPNNEESVAGLYSEIPKGTRLIDTTEHEDGIHLNLSKQFSSGGGSNSMRQRLAELSATVKALKLNKTVTLYVEGLPVNVLGSEGLEVPGAKLFPEGLDKKTAKQSDSTEVKSPQPLKQQDASK